MTDYSTLSEEQLEEALKGRAADLATEHFDAELKVFEEGGAWTAGYFVPGAHPQSAVDPPGVVGIMKVENAASKRAALEGLAHLFDLESERKERGEGG